MQIAFYGSSLLSAYWNGAATYYRGLLGALARLGHAITFYEPDAFDRQSHRDIEPPDWARSVVYPATTEGLRGVLAEAGRADVVVKASGVGVFDDELLAGCLAHARPGAVRVFMDVDAPATLAAIHADAGHPMRRALGSLDLVLNFLSSDMNEKQRRYLMLARDGAEMRAHLAALRDDAGLRAGLAAHGLATIRARHTCAHRVDELFAILRHLGADEDELVPA